MKTEMSGIAVAPDSMGIFTVGGSGAGCCITDRAAKGANRLVAATGSGKRVRDIP